MIGITTISIFVSFGVGLYNYVDEISSSSMADKVLVMPKSGTRVGISDNIFLTDSDLEAVSKTQGVYEESGLNFGPVQIKQENTIKYVFQTSYDPKKDFVLDSFGVGIEEGRALRSGDKNKVLLGYNYLVPGRIFSEKYNLNENMEIGGQKLKIIGFLESIGNPQDDSNVYVTQGYYLDLNPGENTYDQIWVRVDTGDISKVVEDIEKNLRKSRDLEKGKEDFTVESFNDLIESFSGALNVIIGFVILIALISVLVSTINTANTMVTSVLERYKEIGILKSVGARNSEVFSIFLFESSFLGFIAGVLGSILGWGLASFAGNVLKNFGWGFLQPYFSVYLFGGLIIFSVLTGAISGVAPAIRASKIKIVDSLRYE
tara:strand:+ start:3128 stop:4249 length:1122 start_codon:yes stop_codon:yes gene_type:complete